MAGTDAGVLPLPYGGGPVPGLAAVVAGGPGPGFPLAGLIVAPVVVAVRMLVCGRSALTGRIGRHSTTGLAVIPAASLAVAQLDEGVGHSHPQLDSERGIVGGPVGNQGPRAWPRPGFLITLCHTVNTTLNTIAAPAQLRLGPTRPACPPRRPGMASSPGLTGDCFSVLGWLRSQLRCRLLSLAAVTRRAWPSSGRRPWHMRSASGTRASSR